jgi:phosphoserine phosphatase RsbU/P
MIHYTARAAANQLDTAQDGNRRPMMSRRLECAETWAGNKKAASLIELPGLQAWVHSVPAGPGDGGGDVHYFSLCPSCIVSRIALADVSGHGPAVEALGEKLQELMQRYLRALEQIELMRDLNQAVRELLDSVHYATMVAVGWHGRRGLAVMTNAGHPPPLWYRASRDEWTWLETQRASERERLAGVPLGLLPDVSYDRLVVKPQSGDLVVLYSDGVSESIGTGGDELGRDGLMNMVRALDPSSAEALGTRLVAALRAFRGADEPLDDETIIVMRRNDI